MSDRNRTAALRIGLAVVVVVLVFVLGPIVSAPEPERASPAPTVELRPWRLLGCWELRYDGWGEVDAPLSDRSVGADGEPEGALTPPRAVMLLPDSVDPWGRVLPSYRAVPAADAEERAGRSLRWLVEADTLWVLWTEAGVRAGAALRRSGDSLVGSVRAVRRAGGERDSMDLNARATALPINCATGEREPTLTRPAR